jgi:hypothetical protein
VRQAVGIIINTIGIAAAVCGVYFAYMTIRSVVDIVRLPPLHAASSRYASPAVALIGGLFWLELIVFGAVAVISLALAAWILEPWRRWKEWRAARTEFVT